jgi:hypothetical protein
MTWQSSAARPYSGPTVADARPHDVDDLCSIVTISRAHPSDCGQRQVVARLDLASRITLVYGESFTQEVAPGQHHLRVHNTLFWKNVRFAIEPGEHLEFVIINGAKWWTYGIVGLLGSAPLFLTVQRLSLR